MSPGQVQSALGPEPVNQVSKQLSVPQDVAASHIAQLLPLILDRVSPNAQAPAGGGQDALQGLLTRFGL